MESHALSIRIEALSERLVQAEAMEYLGGCGRDERRYDFTSASSMLSHRRGPGPCTGVGGDSRFRHRVWVGRSPAELAIKSSPWRIGRRQNSHNSAKALPAGTSGLPNSGGSHAEVFPNIKRQVTAVSAAAGLFDGLHAGGAHSSVFPKTGCHA